MSDIRRSFTYLIVAGLCLGLHNGVLIAADRVGFALWITILLSFLLVATFGYVGHCVMTFERSLNWNGYVRYCAAMTANIPLSYILVSLLRDVAGLPMAIAAPVSSILMLTINYGLSRWAILRTGHKGIAS